LRAGEQQVGAGEQPAQPCFFAEQFEDARIKPNQGHAIENLKGPPGGGCSFSELHSNQGSPGRYRGCGGFVQLIRRPFSGGKNASSKISAAPGLFPNLKSSAI